MRRRRTAGAFAFAADGDVRAGAAQHVEGELADDGEVFRAVVHPELRRLWDAPDAAVLTITLRDNPHFFDDALIDLYKITPKKYGLLFHFGNPNLSVGEFRGHIRGLVEGQLDRDALNIVADVSRTQTKILEEKVQKFLDDLPTSEERRRAAALPIIHQWAIEGSSLTGNARVADVGNLPRKSFISGR